MSQNPDTHSRDPHYKQAKKEGYRARSAYKLFEIQKMYNIFKRAFYILDLGSVPGSWLQVAKKFAEENLDKYNDSFYHRDHYKIMGADVKKVSEIENVYTIKMDITIPEFQEKVNEYFNYKKLDLILSDTSIKKSGNKFNDQIRQTKLCFKILEICKIHLKKKGMFVIKCFQGTDFDRFFIEMKKEFRLVKAYKPKSSQKKSNEIYIIGMQKK